MKKIIFASLILFIIIGCGKTDSKWKNLIVNNSLEGWHIFQDDGTKDGWRVENEILSRKLFHLG